jgi:hypothetical protein
MSDIDFYQKPRAARIDSSDAIARNIAIGRLIALDYVQTMNGSV